MWYQATLWLAPSGLNTTIFTSLSCVWNLSPSTFLSGSQVLLQKKCLPRPPPVSRVDAEFFRLTAWLAITKKPSSMALLVSSLSVPLSINLCRMCRVCIPATIPRRCFRHFSGLFLGWHNKIPHAIYFWVKEICCLWFWRQGTLRWLRSWWLSVWWRWSSASLVDPP